MDGDRSQGYGGHVITLLDLIRLQGNCTILQSNDSSSVRQQRWHGVWKAKHTSPIMGIVTVGLVLVRVEKYHLVIADDQQLVTTFHCRERNIRRQTRWNIKMTELQFVVQQIVWNDLIHTTTLRTGKQSMVAILSYEHHCITTEATIAIRIATVQLQLNITHLRLRHIGYHESRCSWGQKDSLRCNMNLPCSKSFLNGRS